MSHLLRTAVGLLVIVTCATAFAAGERKWTDYQGTEVRARYITITDGMVRLRQDRKPIAIPFHELSRADRDYLRSELSRRGEEHLLPKIGELRQWNYRDETFEAQFVGPQKDDVILLRNERPQTLPFSSFSQEDQEYVRNVLTAAGQSHLIPKAISVEASEGASFPAGAAGGYGLSGYGHAGGPATYGPNASADSGSGLSGGNVPTYNPSGAGATPSYGGSGSTGQYGASGSVPSYNPGASSAAGGSSWDDPFDSSHAAAGSSPPDIRDRTPRVTLPSVPTFEPSIPRIEFYRECPRCKKRYPTTAEYCTDCSGGVRWRRYSVFGAIIGAIVGIAGAVFRAIRS